MASRFFLLLGSLFLFILLPNCKEVPSSSPVIVNQPDTITTFILLRHAEKMDASEDPDLNLEGQERAQVLASVLENTDIDAIYSTDFKRTQQTVQPLADEKGIDTNSYDPSDLSLFANEILADHKGEKVLVVGHSNTTPTLVNVLTGSNTYQQFEETDYDNLFLVSVQEIGRAEVVWLTYGGE